MPHDVTPTDPTSGSTEATPPPTEEADWGVAWAEEGVDALRTDLANCSTDMLDIVARWMLAHGWTEPLDSAGRASTEATPHGVGAVDKVGIECLCGWTCFFDLGGWLAFNDHLRASTEATERPDLAAIIDRHALTGKWDTARCECGEWDGSTSWAEHVADAIRASTEPDPRCIATAGRCEKEAGHDDDHYTEYRDPVWTHRAEPRPDPALAAPRAEGLDAALLRDAALDVEAVVQEFGHYNDCSRDNLPDHDYAEPVCATRVADLRAAILSLLRTEARRLNPDYPGSTGPGRLVEAAARLDEGSATPDGAER